MNTAITYHIRKRLRPRGGSQYYLDRSEREVTTYCGAEPTAYDDDWNSKAQPWVGQGGPHDGDNFEPCAECISARADNERSTP